MSKKRKTRAQKIKSVQRKKTKSVKKPSKKVIKNQDILVVPVKYIKKDLLKTLIVSLIFTGLIIGLWKYLN